MNNNDIFYKIFCKALLDKTYNDESYICDDVTNNIYKIVLTYFANGKTDSTSKILNLVLNNRFTHESVQSISSICSCTKTSNSSNSNSQSCTDIYNSSMLEYLKILLGDINFYCEFKNSFINEGLAEKLISLLEAFLNKNYSLSFNNTIYCKCCQNSNYDSEHYNNVKIINSYINVLNYIKNDDICNNVNKIKIYGSEFGNLLPKLEFFINI